MFKKKKLSLLQKSNSHVLNYKASKYLMTSIINTYVCHMVDFFAGHLFMFNNGWSNEYC